MTHPRLVESMMDPAFYPHRPEKIEMVQTHISYVFIAGDLVYKVKKPVNFGFLDFTTLEKRRHYCEQEVTLNRRLAPDAYLGVVPIGEDEAGGLRLGEGGSIVEYAVKMIKLPQDQMLKELLARGRVAPERMKDIAEKIVDFHARAATGGEIDEMGRIATVRFNCMENFEQTEKYVGLAVTREKYDFMREYVEFFLAKQRELFERRIAEHRIRDCHGDLHIEHICLIDGIVVFDCIEFNERFRYSDTASEVAFLAMDLDFNGYAHYARAFVDSYILSSGDQDLLKLLDFYMSYRAYVRAKVISFRLDQPGAAEAERKQVVDTASRYYELAFRYAARPIRPTMILISGLMGSGKSVMAKNIGSYLDAKIVRMDVVRKEMLRIAPTERHYEEFGGGIYSEKVSEDAYKLALSMAAKELEEGRSVIIDASFKRSGERLKAKETAARTGADFFVIECGCPDSEIERRLKRRMSNTKEPSDGRWEIFQAQKRDFEPITEIPEGSHIVVDTSKEREKSAMEVLRGIRLGK